MNREDWERSKTDIIYRVETRNGVVSIRNKHNVAIGDIVKITVFGQIYSTYHRAFKCFWGDENDGFHSRGGLKLRPYITNGLYSNIWKVVGIGSHMNYYGTLILHLKDMFGRNLVIGMDGVRIIRKAKKREKMIYCQTLR